MRFALVIGVNRYRHQEAGAYALPPLRYAEPDAEALSDFLANELRFVVKRLTGEQATAEAVLEAFRWLETTTAANPHGNSCFVFHFSGHGQRDPGNDEGAHLMLHDSDPRDPAAAGLEMTHLVTELLQRVRVPNTLVLLDACHAGFAAGIKGASRDIGPGRAGLLTAVARQLFSGRRGRMVLAACPGEQQAREADELGHGVFTHYVLRHWRDLDGDVYEEGVTFDSLVRYVARAMKRHQPNVPAPVYSGSGEGDFFVLRRRHDGSLQV
jgi:uncharacterized caspase-like protein